MNWAVSVDLLEADPTHGVSRPAAENARDRVLTDAEIKGVWDAADRLTDGTGEGFRLLISTGLRKSEIFEAEWSWIDRTENVLTIPASFSKNGQAHRVPLTESVTRILDRIAKDQPTGTHFLFPHPKQNDKPFTSTDRRKEAISEYAGIENDSWVIHDLRRTVSTRMAMAGVPIETIDKVLNHVAKGVTAKHYVSFSYDAEKREALEGWSRRLMTLVSGLKAVERA